MSQIFQQEYPLEKLYNFLDKYCDRKKNKLTLNKSAFKRAKLEENALNIFCSDLKNYYYPSKHHYLERDMIYKNFITIIRQICKYHHLAFTSNIKYFKSKYEIEYFIYQDL